MKDVLHPSPGGTSLPPSLPPLPMSLLNLSLPPSLSVTSSPAPLLMSVLYCHFVWISVLSVGSTGHGAELPYVFHTDISLLGFNYTSDELTMSSSMVQYWTNFAHYGNPNGVHDPTVSVTHSKTHTKTHTDPHT